MLLQLEIVCFFTSFLYILYFTWDRILSWRLQQVEKKNEKQKKQETRKKKREIREETLKVEAQEEDNNPKNYITPEQSEKLREAAKRAQVNISRWYLESARSIIVEWLALKKEDRELNLLLADIYEREKKYQNAMYIYQDMLEIFQEDEYMLQRLGNVYALLGKNKKSFDAYSRALKQNRTNTEILDIMAHLGLELGDFKKSFKYACLYLKEKPRNAEKLWIKGYCLEKQWKIPEAIKVYEKVLDLQPYNSEIQDRIKILQK